MRVFGIDFWHTVEFSRIRRTPLASSFLEGLLGQLSYVTSPRILVQARGAYPHGDPAHIPARLVSRGIPSGPASLSGVRSTATA